jgi:hypothetical protein
MATSPVVPALPSCPLALGGSTTINVKPEDSKDNPGAVSIPPTPSWSVDSISSATLVSLAPAADGMSCVITSTGTPGTVQIDWNVQSPSGPGGANVTLTCSFDLVIAEAPATQAVFTQS